jgi:hypothetical protein
LDSINTIGVGVRFLAITSVGTGGGVGEIVGMEVGATVEVNVIVGVGELVGVTVGVIVGVGGGGGQLFGLPGVAVYGEGAQILHPSTPSGLRPIAVLYPKVLG